MRFSQILEYKRPKMAGAVNAITDPITDIVDQSLQGTMYPEDVAPNLVQTLKKLGWKNIGKGSFSLVFTKPNLPYVLKVNKQPDPAFLYFAKLSIDYPSRHFPKIGNMKKIEYENEPYYIYTIEKLYPITNVPGIVELFTFAQLLDNIARMPREPLERLLRITNGMNDKLQKWIRSHPGLINACQLIGKFKPAGIIDIHEDNIMKRRDGTIVVVDPYAFFGPRPGRDQDEI